MYCSNCDATRDEDHAYCHACGDFLLLHEEDYESKDPRKEDIPSDKVSLFMPGCIIKLAATETQYKQDDIYFANGYPIGVVLKDSNGGWAEVYITQRK